LHDISRFFAEVMEIKPTPEFVQVQQHLHNFLQHQKLANISGSGGSTSSSSNGK